MRRSVLDCWREKKGWLARVAGVRSACFVYDALCLLPPGMMMACSVGCVAVKKKIPVFPFPAVRSSSNSVSSQYLPKYVC